MNEPTPTRCPNCGHMQASIVCSICKADKPRSFHDHRDVPGNLKADRFALPPAYLDQGQYGRGR